MVKKLLAKYRAKRDFTKTAEPSGQATVKQSPEPSFRHPEACGFASALRPEARTERGVQILGRRQGSLPRPA